MDPARIAELLAPFLAPPSPASFLESCHSEPANAGEEPAVLSPAQLQDISTYIDILLRWNARINLTAIRDPDEIVTRHFGESLFAARHLFPGGRAALKDRATGHERIGVPASAPTANEQRPATNDRPIVADLGSGAGFPGIPIKLWAPGISLTLIESSHKKAAFLREVSRALTFTDVNIQTARAEILPAGSFQVVTLRAVERFAAILPVAVNLVAPAGRLALLIGSTQFAQARSLSPELSWSDPEPVPLSHTRILAIAHR